MFSNTCVKRFHTPNTTEISSSVKGSFCNMSLDSVADCILMNVFIPGCVCASTHVCKEARVQTTLSVILRHAMEYIWDKVSYWPRTHQLS